jgi:hypothetical protein
MIERQALAAMLKRAFHEGFNVTREGFNGECSFDHLAPDGLTFEELRDITVEGMLADHDAEPAAKAINGSCGTCNTFTLTDEERASIEWFAEVLKPLTRLTQVHNREKYKDTLRGLLGRLK